MGGILKGKVSKSFHKSWWARFPFKIFSHDHLKASLRDQNHNINDIIMKPRFFQDKDASLLHVCRKILCNPSSDTALTRYLCHQGYLTKGIFDVRRHSYHDLPITSRI